jgi:mevalonate pyrophosphate decarboxylase
MGPAGVEYVYKDELRKLRGEARLRLVDETAAQRAAGLGEVEAAAAARQLVEAWVKAEERPWRSATSAS